MKNLQGKIIFVDGKPGGGKTTFIDNFKREIEGVIGLDSTKITESLYIHKDKNKYNPFKLLKNRNELIKVNNNETIIIDRDIIGVLAFYIYYFDKEKKQDYSERYFGDKTKETKYYENNMKISNNFEILTNRNVIKNIIREYLKNFPKRIQKELHYFTANKEIIINRLKNRPENKNSGTIKKHYYDLINDNDYYDRYEYSIDLAFSLFKEIVKEENLKDWKVVETDTSNL